MKTIIVEDKGKEEKRKERVRRDQELIDGFTYHLKCMGFDYTVDGFCEIEGVRRGIGVDVWVEKIGKKIKLIMNHGRNSVISLSDKCDLDGSYMCVVISSSKKNKFGYISKGIEMENIDQVIEKSGMGGWKRKLQVDKLKVFNIERRLVGA